MAAHCSGCVFTAVSVHSGWVKCRNKFRVWVTILGHTPLPFPFKKNLNKIFFFRFRLCYCSDALAYCSALCSLFLFFFSDLSKILTSADQHSAQTTHFLEKEDTLPPTASSLHSGDRKIQLSTFKQTRENASSGIYLLHELPQNSTKDCGS